MQPTVYVAESLAELRELAKAADALGAPYVITLRPPEAVRAQAADVRFLVSDVDDTLTMKRVWQIMRERLPAELRALDEDFVKHFLAEARKEPPAELVAAQEGAWVAVDVQFMARAGWRRMEVWNLADDMGLRPGVPAFFGRFQARCLVSFGLKDVIDHWLTAHELTVQNVFATQILFGGSPDDPTLGDPIICADPISITTSATKDVHAWEFLSACHAGARDVLAIGDDPRVDRKLWRSGQVNVLVKPPTGPLKADRLTEEDLSVRELSLAVSGIDALNAFLDAVP